MTIFSRVFLGSQFKHQQIVIFENNNGDWGNIVHKFIAFMVVTYRRKFSLISKSIFGCPPSEYCNLSDMKLLIPEWVFSKRTSEGGVCVHCNCDSTNGSIVENVFLNELICLAGMMNVFAKVSKKIVFYRSINEHVHSRFVIIILESNTTSVKWTIHNSKTDIGVVAIHVKTGLALIKRSLSSMFG